MKLSELKKSNDKLNSLTNEQLEAIFELIDLKTEDDMEKVLHKFDLIESRLESKLTDKLETQLKWIIATIVASVGLIIAIIKL